MWKRLKKGGLAIFFVLCGLCNWLLLNIGEDLRDYSDSSRWETVMTSTFDIGKSGQVEYVYFVDERRYTNRRTHFFAGRDGDHARLNEWINSNRQAAEITVYYNPNVPERSVLVPTIDWEWMLQIGITAVIILLSILLPYLFFRYMWGWLRN